MNQFIFLQLNEINFDVTRSYIEKHNDLPAFKQLLIKSKKLETYSEVLDEQQEPWIQWVSAHTGKTYAEHQIFRLGDIATAAESLNQIFEVLERAGLKVGAVSPMNARNRLTTPAYFIPDPWTDAVSDGSGFSRRLTKMLRQTVNDNSAGKLSGTSILTLIESAFRSFEIKGSFNLLRYIALAIKNKWYRALVLDQLLHLVHLSLWQKHKPDASFVFLNAGAHIQHHYFLNSKVLTAQRKNPSWYAAKEADPIHDMLKAYDTILGNYLDLVTQGTQLLVATGLSQVPFQEAKFFYRLKDHMGFLSLLGINSTRVMPRMTRDFEIYFDSHVEKERAKALLEGLVMQRDGVAIFGLVEVREQSIFTTLTYPHEIYGDDKIAGGGVVIHDFGMIVVFVAIKNGTHCPKGFAYIVTETDVALPAGPVHVAELFNVTKALCL